MAEREDAEALKRNKLEVQRILAEHLPRPFQDCSNEEIAKAMHDSGHLDRLMKIATAPETLAAVRRNMGIPESTSDFDSVYESVSRARLESAKQFFEQREKRRAVQRKEGAMLKIERSVCGGYVRVSFGPLWRVFTIEAWSRALGKTGEFMVSPAEKLQASTATD